MTQVFHQVKYRLVKPAYKTYDTSGFKFQVLGFRIKTEPIAKPQCWDGEKFTFLNLTHEFSGWDFNEFGNLWTYNQNYFDWLNQEGMTAEEGCKWIDRFMEEIAGQARNEEGMAHGSTTARNEAGMALDPYPIALRSINWVKFFCKHPECATKERVDALYSQVKLLEKKLEYHLLGNHLLEDSYALYFVGAYFNEKALIKKAKKLLLAQLDEQVLPDGAHCEQSPMYHCILLDRLLDCININTSPELERYASKMLGHLENVAWNDGTIPLLNDSAYGIAPTPEQIFDYARRLGLEWEVIPMRECGYRKLIAEGLEAIVDVGNITATYQPGHTHADSLNYELRIDGKPFVVDCGISTYNKTVRRQYERGTAAHNCVVVGGKNSSEVWGGFRVARRATVSGAKVQGSSIEAEHDGYEKPCKRRFEMKEDGFIVEDWYDGEAISYVHLAEGADEKRINIEGAEKVKIKPWQYSTEYNRFKEGKEIIITFKNYVKYTIQ